MMMQKRTMMEPPSPRGLDWENLRVFLAVARQGSARKAAEVLAMHYTSITRRLSNFEEQIGGRLFDKGTSGYQLTQLGQSVLRHVEAMEEEAFAVERQLSGADERITGRLRVATTTTIAAYLIADELREFRQANPGIDLEIRTGYAFADLSRGEADVTIRASNEPGDRLVGRRFGHYHQSIYARPDYLDAHPPGTDGSGCLWMDWMRPEVFRQRLAKSEFPFVEHYMQVEDEVVLLELAKSGMGMATLPCFYGDRAAGLVRVSARNPESVLGMWLLTHPELARNARVRRFVEFFAQVLRAKQSLLAGASRAPGRKPSASSD